MEQHDQVYVAIYIDKNIGTSCTSVCASGSQCLNSSRKYWKATSLKPFFGLFSL